MGEWKYSSAQSLFMALDGGNGQLTLATLSLGKDLYYPLKRKLDGPQSQSG